MCVGDGVNTESSLFPGESCACSNLLEPCSCRRGTMHKGQSQHQLRSVPRVSAHGRWEMEMGLLFGEKVAGSSAPSLPSLSLHGKCVLQQLEQQGLSLLLS